MLDAAVDRREIGPVMAARVYAAALAAFRARTLARVVTAAEAAISTAGTAGTVSVQVERVTPWWRSAGAPHAGDTVVSEAEALSVPKVAGWPLD